MPGTHWSSGRYEQQTGDRAPEAVTVEWYPVGFERVRVTRQIRRPSLEADQALRIRPDQLIQVAYGCGASGQDEAKISLAPLASQSWFRVPASFEVRTPAPDHRAAAISLRWQATRFARHFPVMDADLEVRPAANGETTLVLDGTYQPPLGLIGLIFDHLLGRRIAVATAKDFVVRLARSIEDEPSSTESTGDPAATA